MGRYDEFDDYERPRRRRRQPDDNHPLRQSGGYDAADEAYDEDAERPRRRREAYEATTHDLRGAAGARRPRERERYDDDDDGYDDMPRMRRQPQRRNSGGGGAGCIVWSLYGILGIAALAFVVYMLLPRLTGTIAEGVTAPIANLVNTPTPTIFDRGGAIRQIRALNRLETQNFTAERIIEANVQRGNALDFFLGERLLLVASGDVVAGVDLSKLQDGDVTISDDGSTIAMQLPPSEIFRAALDNGRTRVYDRDTRLGTQLFGGQDPNLETQARQSAEGEILNAACEYNITQKAATEAQKNMEQFLGLLGFQNITVTAPAGPCVAPASGAQAAPTIVLPTITP